MKKLVIHFLLLSILVSAGLVSCNKSKTAPKGAETAGETLIMSYPSDPGMLNPHTYSSPQWIQALVYEGLTRFKDGKVIPAIAESWDVSPDGKEYTFHLRKGNVFSDGTPVNAAIVKKNFDAVLKHKDEHNWMESVNQLQEVVIVDDNTVKLILRAPFSATLQELALSRPLRIGAEALFPESGDTAADGILKPLGGGMWMLKEYVPEQYIIFERNEKYWGQKPSFRYLEVRIIPDINTAANALKAGEINLLYDIEGQMTGDIFNDLKNSGLETVISNPVYTTILALNTARGATRELAVRYALEYAIDKKSIADNVFYGLETPADTLMPVSTPYCNVPLTPYNYDPEKAVEFLENAGWLMEQGSQYRRKNGQELRIKFSYLGDNEAAKIIGQVLQNQYGKIGANIELIAQDDQSYYASQEEGLFEMMLTASWGDPFDPHSYFSSFRHPSHSDYAAQLGLSMKPQIDKAISTALNSTDEEETQANYTYVIRTLHEQAVYVPLTYPTRQMAFPVEIQGVRFNTRADVPLEEFRIVSAKSK
ncbi:MAG: nickel ABC transporter substrate-binding protein [Treponema sp.]|jgi:nickel transport system substrate-binding protein|nr:nickel ABC transporter substrate-binding protein [Treponema sp.]